MFFFNLFILLSVNENGERILLTIYDEIKDYNRIVVHITLADNLLSYSKLF